MTFAGLKKCIPIVFPGFLTTPPISLMSRVEVFVARMQESGTIVSSCLKICAERSGASSEASAERSEAG